MAFLSLPLHTGMWHIGEGHTRDYGLEHTVLVAIYRPHTCLSLANTDQEWHLPLSPVHTLSCQHLLHIDGRC